MPKQPVSSEREATSPSPDEEDGEVRSGASAASARAPGSSIVVQRHSGIRLSGEGRQEASPLVRLDWTSASGKPCLVFRFGRRLSASQATPAIAAWHEAFVARQGQRIVVVWDCRQMEAYDDGARIAWQQAIAQMRAQIDSIWLVAGSFAVKMSAAAMGMATRIPIKIVNSIDEVLP